MHRGAAPLLRTTGLPRATAGFPSVHALRKNALLRSGPATLLSRVRLSAEHVESMRWASSRSSGTPNRRSRKTARTAEQQPKRRSKKASAAQTAETSKQDSKAKHEATNKDKESAGTPPIVVYPQTLVPSSVLEMISTPQQGAPANQGPSSLQLNAIFIWPKGVRRLLVDDMRIRKQKLLLQAQHTEEEAKVVEPAAVDVAAAAKESDLPDQTTVK